MSTIQDILAEFREAARNKRDMGDKFERLFVNYLRKEPCYRDRFSNVWMWSEWPGRNNRPDTGIDVVAEDRDGSGLCAIQCKFYDPDATLQKGDLDSFFATSGQSSHFTSRIVVSTTDNWSRHAEDLLNDDRIPCARIRLQDLGNSVIDWSQFSLSRPDEMKLRAKKELRPHQQEAVRDVLKGLDEADRGKLIMACGTGKTFTALKIAEAFAQRSAAQRSAAQRSAAQRSAAQRSAAQRSAIIRFACSSFRQSRFCRKHSRNGRLKPACPCTRWPCVPMQRSGKPPIPKISAFTTCRFRRQPMRANSPRN